MAVEVKISKFRRSGARVFTGRDNGVKARNELNLDEKEKQNQIINVLIPKDIWSINPSFFGGMFEDSIKLYQQEFEKHYKFMYSDKSELKEALAQNIKSNINYVQRSIGGGE